MENRKGKSVSAREEKEGLGGEIKRYQDNKKGHIEKEGDTKMRKEREKEKGEGTLWDLLEILSLGPQD